LQKAHRIDPESVWSSPGFRFSQAFFEPDSRHVHVNGQAAWGYYGNIVGPCDPYLQCHAAVVSNRLFYPDDDHLEVIQAARRERSRSMPARPQRCPRIPTTEIIGRHGTKLWSWRPRGGNGEVFRQRRIQNATVQSSTSPSRATSPCRTAPPDRIKIERASLSDFSAPSRTSQ